MYHNKYDLANQLCVACFKYFKGYDVPEDSTITIHLGKLLEWIKERALPEELECDDFMNSVLVYEYKCLSFCDFNRATSTKSSQ